MLQNVEPEIWIAIIAASASILVSVVALIASISTARSQNNSAIETEKLKLNLSREKEKSDTRASARKAQVEAMAKQITSLQDLRDYLFFLHNAPKGSVAVNRAKMTLDEAAENIITTYKDTMNVLDRSDTEAFHKVKNVVIGNVQQIANLFDKNLIVGEESPTENMILALRSQLADIQNNIRDRRDALRDANER